MMAAGCVRDKIKSQKGFTLMEQMVAIALLVLVSLLMAAGIPVAIGAYNKVVKAANAQVLLSTTVTELRDELGMACEVYSCGPAAAEGAALTYPQAIVYRKEGTGKLRIDSAGPGGETGVWFAYLDMNGNVMMLGEGKPNPRQLVSEAAATRNLYAAFASISCSDGVISIGGLQVYDSEKKPVLENPVDLEIRMKVAKG